MEQVKVSVFQDARRKKKTGKYPVKIRVTNRRISFFVPTRIDLSEEDFEKMFSGRRLSESLENIKREIDELILKVNGIISDLPHFSKESFLKLFRGENNPDETVIQFSIDDAFAFSMSKPNLKIATKQGYQTALHAIKRFLNRKDLLPGELEFSSIDVRFLRDFHAFLLDEKKSLASIGLYMRTLRAVMNDAIADNKLTLAQYPFGRRKYVPPVAKSTKDVLSKDELRRMMELELEHPSLECFSRDWFLLCYLCNGMNIGDLLNLRNEDLRSTGFHFIREKTRTTSNGEAGHIRVDFGESWRDLVLAIIERQRNYDRRPFAYLFECLPEYGTELERMRRKQAFIRRVNQHLPKVCNLAGIKKHISSQTARHTFASNLYLQDVSIAEIQAFLGHTSPKTTENYLHSLLNEKTKRAIENLL
jgi:integrase/recombinase XerD